MYIVIGGDGKEYGPKASVEVRDWIAEGRLNAQSQIKEQSDDEWKVLGSLQEFAADFAGSNPAIPQTGVTPPPPGITPPPQIQHFPVAGNPAAAQAMVNGPATFMMVLGILNIVSAIIGLVMNLAFGGLGIAAADSGAPEEGMGLIFQAVGGIVGNIVAIIVSIVIIMGSVKMKNLQSYGLSMTAAILCIVCCVCCIGIAPGIWSIVVLSKPEVKAAFR